MLLPTMLRYVSLKCCDRLVGALILTYDQLDGRCIFVAISIIVIALCIAVVVCLLYKTSIFHVAVRLVQ